MSAEGLDSVTEDTSTAGGNPVGPIENAFTSSFGAIAPLVIGSTSVIASLAIIYIIARSVKGFSCTYHRLIAAMSFFDILKSGAIALATIPMPKEGDDYLVDQYGFEGLRLGNAQTCKVQSLLVVAGAIGTYGYVTSLCIYYAAAIYYCIPESRIAKVVEPLLHFVQLGSTLGLTLSFLFLGTAANVNPYLHSWCSLQTGADSNIMYQLGVLLLVLGCIYFLLVIASLSLVVLKVFQQNRKITQYLQSANLGSSIIANRLNMRKRLARVASIQSFAYIISFLLTTMFQVINILVRRFVDHGTSMANVSLIQYLQLMFQPSMGIFNFLVFVSSKILITRYTSPDVSICEAFGRLFAYQQSAINEVITGINFSRAQDGGIEPVWSEDFESWDEFESDGLPFSTFNVTIGRANNVSGVSSTTSISRRGVSSTAED